MPHSGPFPCAAEEENRGSEPFVLDQVLQVLVGRIVAPTWLSVFQAWTCFCLSRAGHMGWAFYAIGSPVVMCAGFLGLLYVWSISNYLSTYLFCLFVF